MKPFQINIDFKSVDKHIEKEIGNSDSVRAELNDIVMRMEEVMSKIESPPPIVQPNTVPPAEVHSNVASGIPQQSKMKARLAKLEGNSTVRSRSGKNSGTPKKAPSTKTKATQPLTNLPTCKV